MQKDQEAFVSESSVVPPSQHKDKDRSPSWRAELNIQAPAALLASQTSKESGAQLTLEDVAQLADGVKFADCVPADLLSRTIAARLFVSTL